MSKRYNRILEILKSLNPSYIDLVDDSHKHAGHVAEHGHVTGDGETHYKLVMVSDEFKNLSRIERQQKINFLLSGEFKTGLHAFQMKLMSSDEWKG